MVGVRGGLPLKLADRVIKYASNPGDLVMDPFAGSGTTLVSAKSLGRMGLGYEKNEAYCEIIVDRLKKPREASESVKKSRSNVDLFEDE